jgi:hypothetical protein
MRDNQNCHVHRSNLGGERRGQMHSSIFFLLGIIFFWLLSSREANKIIFSWKWEKGVCIC